MSQRSHPQVQERGAGREECAAAGTDAPARPRKEDLAGDVLRRARRAARSAREGEPTLMRQLAAVGVLGWIVVVPPLGGIALGRWIDRDLGTGLTFTAGLLTAGVGLGCWLAWRWMHGR